MEGETRQGLSVVSLPASLACGYWAVRYNGREAALTGPGAGGRRTARRLMARLGPARPNPAALDSLPRGNYLFFSFWPDWAASQLVLVVVGTRVETPPQSPRLHPEGSSGSKARRSSFASLVPVLESPIELQEQKEKDFLKYCTKVTASYARSPTSYVS